MQGKYPLWYIKLFFSYHWTKITHKNENWGPFVFPRVENRFSEPNFRWFFFFEVRYLQNHQSDVDDFFCKVMTIQFSFQIKKETVRKIETFEKKLKFRIFDRFRFFRSLIRISIFFGKFEISLDYGFLDWKGYKIVSSLQKTSEKFDQRFWRYRTSKEKYHLNFATCGFGTLIFDP